MAAITRHAVLADYPAVERLAAEILISHATALPDIYRVVEPALPESRFRDLLIGAATALFVAEHDGAIAGYAECALMPASANTAIAPQVRATIDTIVVAAAMQGMGIGQALFDACAAWAKGRGARSLVLNVWEFNARAIAFYERRGMATVQRRMMLPLD